MSCRHFRDDISLLAGRDLDDPRRVESVRSHMAECPVCRDRYGRLRDGLSVLAASDAGVAAGGATWSAREESCWPQVQQRLAGRGRSPADGRSTESRLPNWAAVTALAASALVVVTVFLTEGGVGGQTLDPMPVAVPEEGRPAYDSQGGHSHDAMPADSRGLRLTPPSGTHRLAF